MSERLGRTFVLRVVLASAAIAFVLESLLSPNDAAALVARVVGYALSIPFFWAIGWWFGTRTWPKRGRKLARRMAYRSMKARGEVLFISDRPDADGRVARRIWEVVGFAAGASILLASALILVGLRTASVSVPFSFTILALWAGFLLVPYWLFGAMGLRSVDAVRWLVLPVSRRYADRMKLSNGALILLGIGMLFNALYREGLSQDQAIAGALITVLRIVTSVLVIAAPAVAYYHRDEHGLVRVVETELLDIGVRDGRGMTDGEFLPRLPPPKVAPPEPEPLMEHKVMRP